MGIFVSAPLEQAVIGQAIPLVIPEVPPLTADQRTELLRRFADNSERASLTRNELATLARELTRGSFTPEQMQAVLGVLRGPSDSPHLSLAQFLQFSERLSSMNQQGLPPARQEQLTSIRGAVAARLVGHLQSEVYTIRQSAHCSLVRLGMDAFEALRAGISSTDTERSHRSQRALNEMADIHGRALARRSLFGAAEELQVAAIEIQQMELQAAGFLGNGPLEPLADRLRQSFASRVFAEYEPARFRGMVDALTSGTAAERARAQEALLQEGNIGAQARFLLQGGENFDIQSARQLGARLLLQNYLNAEGENRAALSAELTSIPARFLLPAIAEARILLPPGRETHPHVALLDQLASDIGRE